MQESTQQVGINSLQDSSQAPLPAQSAFNGSNAATVQPGSTEALLNSGNAGLSFSESGLPSVNLSNVSAGQATQTQPVLKPAHSHWALSLWVLAGVFIILVTVVWFRWWRYR